MSTLGSFAVFAATAFSVASLICYLMAWRGKESALPMARAFFVGTSVAISIAMFILVYLFVTHDYSVAYVANYSSNDLPLYFTIASTWGGQEGTFLLWIFFTIILGAVMMRTSKGFENGNMFFLNLFLLSILVILLKRSPFTPAEVVQADGSGLNPLLQNYWMTIHPPVMFVGFAAAVFPFCFAMTALVERRYNLWAESARRWTLFAWGALGIALVMGGYWAYETLGWGGFWAWDPVENSSFIPWIFLVAQIHSLFIKKQRRGLLRFSLVVVCLTFFSVLYGTFLTRSGVLADFSVHSFVELGINSYLVGGLLLFVGIGTFLLILRWKDIDPEPSYSEVASRSYLVTLAIVIFFLGGLLTLFGTSAPLLTSWFGEPANVGLPYYFATMTPIAVAVLFLLSLFPGFRWNEGLARPKLLMVAGAAFVLTIVFCLALGITTKVIYLLLFGAVMSSLVTNGWMFITHLQKGDYNPAYLAHLGVILAIAGAAISAGFETKQTVTLPHGKEVQAMGYSMTFTGVSEHAKGFDCHLNMTASGRDFVAVLPHEFPKNAQGVMKRPYIEKFWTFDIYLSPLSLEQGNHHDPGILEFSKGDTKKLDKYEISFEKFELSGHGENGSASSAVALVSISYDGKTEQFRPMLTVQHDSVASSPVTFDNDRATLAISGIRPDDGGVALKVSGDFLPTNDASDASLVLELSVKPGINLFWVGTLMLFGGGLSAMRERGKHKKAAPVASPEMARVATEAK
jgi:cytochrome c-type biogenesis protein CcmF